MVAGSSVLYILPKYMFLQIASTDISHSNYHAPYSYFIMYKMQHAKSMKTFFARLQSQTAEQLF